MSQNRYINSENVSYLASSILGLFHYCLSFIFIIIIYVIIVIVPSIIGYLAKILLGAPFYIFYVFCIGTSVFQAIMLVISFIYTQSREHEFDLSTNKILLNCVEDVCKQVGVSNFDGVIIDEKGGIATFQLRNQTFLKLNAYALLYLTRNELKAIISHECSHHLHNSMAIYKYHHKVLVFQKTIETHISIMAEQNDLMKVYKITADMGKIGLLAFQNYVCLVNMFIADKDYEYYCDHVAVSLYGKSIFKSAINKIIDLQIAHKEDVNIKSNGVGEYVKQIADNIKHINAFDKNNILSYESNTHPSLASRLQKIENIGFFDVEDNSKSIFSKKQLEELLFNYYKNKKDREQKYERQV